MFWRAKKHFQFSREWSLLSDISHMDQSGCFLKKTSKVRIAKVTQTMSLII